MRNQLTKALDLLDSLRDQHAVEADANDVMGGIFKKSGDKAISVDSVKGAEENKKHVEEEEKSLRKRIDASDDDDVKMLREMNKK